jgi:hypothetical protein
MSVCIGKAVFHDWASLRLTSAWTDTAVFRMLPTAGLPPRAYAQIVRPLARAGRKMRPGLSVWIQLWGSPGPWTRAPREGAGRQGGIWYAEVVRRELERVGVPVAITYQDTPPSVWDFTYPPWMDKHPAAGPPFCKPLFDPAGLRLAHLDCLRALARADCAFTAEVASLTGLHRNTAARLLQDLAEKKYVSHNEKGGNPIWRLRRPGLTQALRSWGHVPGMPFPGRTERGRDACKERKEQLQPLPGAGPAREPVTFWASSRRGTRRRKLVTITPSVQRRRPVNHGRHRRTARLWPEWLRQALPQAEIWTGWTEVNCAGRFPDALAWGSYQGYETLFWLEVERGGASRVQYVEKTARRLKHASQYARSFRVRLIFNLLGPRWIREAVISAVRMVPDDMALVLANWMTFGELPDPRWGRMSLSREHY